jgi:septal ring factor EnvC (AmiA/AmiB activator)
MLSSSAQKDVQKTEDNLSKIEKALPKLKSMAVEMGRNIDEQNARLDILAAKQAEHQDKYALNC